MSKRVFRNQITEEYVAMHLMYEAGKQDLPVDLFIGRGFDLLMSDKAKYRAIVKMYEMDIERCVKRGIGDRKGFKYRPLSDEIRGNE